MFMFMFMTIIIIYVHILAELPELYELDHTLCKDAITTERCNYYESHFRIGCTANSWKSFMMDACYKKCSKCKV